VRRFGSKLVIASSTPTALDAGAIERITFAPGTGEAFLRALQKALLETDDETEEIADRGQGRDQVSGGTSTSESHDADVGEHAGIEGQARLAAFLAEHSLERLAELAEIDVQDLRDAAAHLTAAENVVVIWGERLGHGLRGPGALGALGDLALVLGLDAGDGSGLIEVPAETNGRGLREVGCVAGLGPGLVDTHPGKSATEARDFGAGGSIRAFYLLHSDPMRDLSEQQRWDEALGAASFVIAHEQFLGVSSEQHADVVFPAESYAEKEGTMTHPDGRLQRLRPAIGRPGEVRMGWEVLADIGTRLGLDLVHHLTAAVVLEEIAEHSPLYRNITPDEIGGRGVRWPEREGSRAGAAEVIGALSFSDPDEPMGAPRPHDGQLRLALARDLWASPEIEHAPSLEFLRANQRLLLNPADARRLGLARGDRVQVYSNGNMVETEANPREAVKPGTCHLFERTAEQNANLLTNGLPSLVAITKVEAQ
jgi:NADH-quinone oxidoreductase subunit G